MTRLCIFLAALLCFLCFAASSNAATQTFTPTDDSYVSSAATSTNYGTNPTLRMQTSPTKRAYLRFNVSLPVGSTVTGATFRIYTSSISPGTGFRVYSVSDTSWTEGSITYSNQPGFGSEIGSSGTYSVTGWKTVALPSSYVHTGANSVGATVSSTYEKVFSSSESINQPELIVDYTTGTPTPTPTPTATPPPGGSHTLTAVGDYAGSATDSESTAVKNVVVGANPELHLGLGDYNYNDIGTILSGFDKIWGPKPNGVWPKFRPTAGPTHDVTSCSDSRYQTYWGRPAMQGYSFNVGNWHIISLPSAAYRYGCATSSILSWLNNDLAANNSPCELAFWHEPYWTSTSSSHSRTTAVKPWIQSLYDDGAEIVLSGHQHNYERFAPQNPSDQVDNTRGIRQFVVGTGGIGFYGFTSTAANSQVRTSSAYGALKLTLTDTGYSWQFLRAAGTSFTDSGSGSCH